MRNHSQLLLENVYLNEIAFGSNEKYFLDHFINPELMETDEGIDLVDRVNASHTYYYEIMRASLDGLSQEFNSGYEALKFAIDKYRIVMTELKDANFRIDKHTIQVKHDANGNPTEPYNLNGVALYFKDIRVDGLYLISESLAMQLGYFEDNSEPDDLSSDDIM